MWKVFAYIIVSIGVFISCLIMTPVPDSNGEAAKALIQSVILTTAITVSIIYLIEVWFVPAWPKEELPAAPKPVIVYKTMIDAVTQACSELGYDYRLRATQADKYIIQYDHDHLGSYAFVACVQRGIMSDRYYFAANYQHSQMTVYPG